MTFFPPNILSLAETVLNNARAKKLRIATAESCTGGLITGCLTEIAGSSDVIEVGYLTYSNESKTADLGVPTEMLMTVGAVSVETAQQMAKGAIARSRADIAVSVTGIAGPGGATPVKPVGLVYIGFARKNGKSYALKNNFGGGRSEVRLQAMETALRILLNEIAEI